MRVFLTGGTGALGACLLPLLRDHGHTVSGLTRSPEGAALMARHGAQVIAGDLFNPAALQAGCAAAEAIVDCSTVEPRLPRPGGRDWSVNDRIRAEGVRALVAAAAAAGVGRYVHCGLGLVYGDHGDAWVHEQADLRTPPLLRSAREGEAAVLEAQRSGGLDAVVLRMGTLYGPGLAATGRLIGLVRRRLVPLSGNTKAFTSFLHVNDAAAAILLALERRATPRVINVGDDEPARLEEWLPWLARAAGAPSPLRLPSWLAALLEDRVERVERRTSVRMTNGLARTALGFAPAFPTYREGFQATLAHWSG